MSMTPEEKGAAQEVVYTAHRGVATTEQLVLRMRVLIVTFMFLALGLLGAGVGVNIGVLVSVHSTQTDSTQTIQAISHEVDTINQNVLLHDSELGQVLAVACQLIENSKNLTVPAACTQQPGPTK